MNRARTWIVTGAAAAGAMLGAAGIAAAASNSNGQAAATSTSTSTPAPDERPGGVPGIPGSAGHGPGETLLTGTTAEKVKAAALAAVPGATVIRVETDSAGSPYEAHMRKADGTKVTVKVDANFKITATETASAAATADTGHRPLRSAFPTSPLVQKCFLNGLVGTHGPRAGLPEPVHLAGQVRGRAL